MDKHGVKHEHIFKVDGNDHVDIVWDEYSRTSKPLSMLHMNKGSLAQEGVSYSLN